MLPSLARLSWTFCDVPDPMVTMAMTAATPITMPSRVRTERNGIAPDRLKGQLDRFPQHQAASRRVSVSMRPSTKRMVRVAKAGHVRLVGYHHHGDALRHIQLV